METARFDAWNGTTASYPQSSGAAAPSDAGNGITITPSPEVWGWGLILDMPNSTEDLSNFNVPSGRLNFSIKTTYAGKLEIGFYTGSAATSTGYDVYLPISSGQYGYVNDGAWHDVSIPISAIVARGAPAYGMPNSAALNMAQIPSLFVIADRYAVTGNTTQTTSIKLDAIYWSK